MTYVLRKRELRSVDYIEVDYEYELTKEDLRELAENGLHESDPEFETKVLQKMEREDWFCDDYEVVEEDQGLENIGEYEDSQIEFHIIED